MAEIERKFFPKTLPNLTSLIPKKYQRFIIFQDEGVELRIQQVDNEFELERKIENNNLSRETFKVAITESEFNLLKALSTKSIVRDSYQLGQHPDISLKIYHGDCEGLIRLEVEFETEVEAQAFVPPDWYGIEITNNPLGRDGKLVQLSKDQFIEEIHKLRQ